MNLGITDNPRRVARILHLRAHPGLAAPSLSADEIKALGTVERSAYNERRIDYLNEDACFPPDLTRILNHARRLLRRSRAKVRGPRYPVSGNPGQAKPPM